MATPAIQTLLTDAQQVLNLNSLSEVRSTMAAALANANVGTPLNPNLTTQQLWDEFYLIVRQPESDIESIITNQLMKFLFAPPAPGGAGADQQVIFNDGGVLAGDPQFLWNKTTNLLTVTGSATITGDLTVDTSTLKVDSTNNRVGILTASPTEPLTINNTSGVGTTGALRVFANDQSQARISLQNTNGQAYHFVAGFPGASNAGFALFDNTAAATRYYLDNTGVHSWLNVGGVAGTAMTLNSTGLGVGAVPSASKFLVSTGTSAGIDLFRSDANANFSGIRFRNSANSATNAQIGWNGNELRLEATTSFSLATNGVENRINVDGSGNVISNVTGTAPTLAANSQMVFNLTSNTNLRISVRGTDGTTRTANITLA